MSASASASPSKPVTSVLNEASLAALWQKTSGQLDTTWDQIGWTAEERRACIVGIGEKLAAIAGGFVQSAQADKKQLEDAIHQTRNHIADTCRRLNKIFLQDEYTRVDATQALRVQHSALQAKLAQLHALRDEHETKVKAALSELHGLWDKLGTVIAEQSGFEGVVHDISEGKLQQIAAKVGDANTECARRAGVVTDRVRECNELIKELALIAADLTAAIDSKITATDVAGLGVHINTLNELDARLAAFKQIKATRQQRIQSLAIDISALWNRLRVADRERQAFFNAHSGLTASTVAACEHELERCRALKKSLLKEFVGEAKTKLNALWDDTLVHPTERQKFKPAFMADPAQWTDETLDSFESEIARVETRASKMAPLLGLIKERAGILEDKSQFDALIASSADDPTKRFKIPGFLLKEEKLRKQLQSRLPKLNEMLRNQIPVWERENGPLLANGVSVIAQIEADAHDALNKSIGSAGAAAVSGKKKAAVASENAAPAAASGSCAAAAKKGGDKTPSKPNAGKVAKTPQSGMKRPATASASAAKATPGATASAKKVKNAAGGADSARASTGGRPILGQLNFNE